MNANLQLSLNEKKRLVQRKKNNEKQDNNGIEFITEENTSHLNVSEVNGEWEKFERSYNGC